jgi:hypothetical protein
MFEEDNDQITVISADLVIEAPQEPETKKGRRRREISDETEILDYFWTALHNERLSWINNGEVQKKVP